MTAGTPIRGLADPLRDRRDAALDKAEEALRAITAYAEAQPPNAFVQIYRIATAAKRDIETLREGDR